VVAVIGFGAVLGARCAELSGSAAGDSVDRGLWSGKSRVTKFFEFPATDIEKERAEALAGVGAH